MRRTILWVAGSLAIATTPAAAQDSAGPPAAAPALRQRIEERFAQRVQEELGLSGDQTAKLRVTAREFAGRRRGLEAQERDLRQALSSQLRPGVAADQDSVARITNDLVNLKLEYAQTFRDEMKDFSGYLSPVQRGQLFLMRERLLQRVEDIRNQRGDAGPRRWRLRAR